MLITIFGARGLNIRPALLHNGFVDYRQPKGELRLQEQRGFVYKTLCPLD